MTLTVLKWQWHILYCQTIYNSCTANLTEIEIHIAFKCTIYFDFCNKLANKFPESFISIIYEFQWIVWQQLKFTRPGENHLPSSIPRQTSSLRIFVSNCPVIPICYWFISATKIFRKCSFWDEAREPRSTRECWTCLAQYVQKLMHKILHFHVLCSVLIISVTKSSGSPFTNMD